MRVSTGNGSASYIRSNTCLWVFGFFIHNADIIFEIRRKVRTEVSIKGAISKVSLHIHANIKLGFVFVVNYSSGFIQNKRQSTSIVWINFPLAAE